MLSPGDVNALIVGFGKTRIVLVLKENDAISKAILQHLLAAIFGVIVHHNHLCLYAFQGTKYGLQALLQEVLDVVVDDDDRELDDAGGLIDRQ